jgi:hypothetical protein
MKIDIEDINYLSSHEELNPPFRKQKYSANIFELLIRWAYLIYRGLLSIRYFFFNCYKSLPSCDVLFLSVTGNNFRTLQPIQQKTENSAIFRISNRFLYKTAFYAMIYSPIVFGKYLKAKGYMKKAYVRKFLDFSLSYGYFIEAQTILNKINPKMLILANDHSYPQRAFLRVAQNLNIKTGYVQHASVANHFPPLEFDYAFLDGQESLDKYLSNGKVCKSTVFLSGSSRFDIIQTIRSSEKSGNIIKCGIAINSLDKLEKIEQLIKLLQTNINDIEIAIRPHPAMQLSLWKIFASANQCSISDSKTENPFVFIGNNNVFISGESSFHLDVALLGKVSYYYNFTDYNNLDCYGYLASGLMQDISHYSGQAIKESLNSSHETNVSLLNYYVSTFDTRYWGHSAGLIAGTISHLLQGNVPDFWDRQTGNKYILTNNKM